MSSSHLEEALRRSEEFAARLIESSRDSIKVLDLQGHLLSINAHGMTALEICDFGPLLGSPWVEFWDGKDREHAKAALEQARQGRWAVYRVLPDDADEYSKVVGRFRDGHSRQRRSA